MEPPTFLACSSNVEGRLLDRSELPAVRAFEKGEVVFREEVNLHAPDRTRRVCISATPVRGPDGGIIAAVAICEDLTASREQEAEQRRLREEERLARAEAKAQAAFLANMSHELRSPGACCSV